MFLLINVNRHNYHNCFLFCSSLKCKQTAAMCCLNYIMKYFTGQSLSSKNRQTSTVKLTHKILKYELQKMCHAVANSV